MGEVFRQLLLGVVGSIAANSIWDAIKYWLGKR